MILKSTNDALRFGFITFVVLISINLWSFQVIPDNIYRLLEGIAIIGLLLIVIYHNNILRDRLIFKVNVLFFILIPIVSSYSAFVYHDQALGLSLFLIRFSFLWLFYFVLHIFDVPAEKIIKLILFVGFVWIALTLIQQITYPNALFYTKQDSENYSIYRAGVQRFMINGQQYGAFLLLYSFYKYLTTHKKNYLFLVLFGLVGFYYFGTRQYAISAFASMLLAVTLVKGRAQLNAIVLFMLILPLLIIFKDQLFAQYIEITYEQRQHGPDQRTLTANFFLFEYWPHWITKIIGNGPIHKTSSYGYEMELLRHYYHYYRSDVGIIGAYNAFGIFHVINILSSNLKVLGRKYFTYETRYLKLVFFYFIIILVTSEFYSVLEGIPFYCLLFYLTDKSYQEKKELQEEKSEMQLAELSFQ